MDADRRDALRSLVPQYDAVFTYGGGPWCREQYLSLCARAYFSIYNGLDPEMHFPVPPDPELSCDVAFLGNRLPDREARVEEFFLHAAELSPQRRFLLGGEGRGDKPMPAYVRYIGHVPAAGHNRVNCSAGMVMNINRASMAQAGFSPPTRVFEVAGGGTCLLCDDWPEIDDCFEPGKEILVVRSAQDIADAITTCDEDARRRIGENFHNRALRDHSYAQRAMQADAGFRHCLGLRAETVASVYSSHSCQTTLPLTGAQSVASGEIFATTGGRTPL